LIESLKQLNKNNPVIECNLYGPVHPSILKRMNRKIIKYELNGILKYKGNVNNNEIPAILAVHDLLLLPRKSNLQTKFGFPTKLAEYMASGVPVLSSDVSDISNYLTDGENGFLIKELKIKPLIDKIENIINNNERLSSIGKCGKETAFEFFNYRNYSDILYDFFFNNE
jgi:glycosyltransferase involved in cell wall biosynthesis